MGGLLVPRRRMAGAVRMALLVCAVLLTVAAAAGSAASASPVVAWGGNFCGFCSVPAGLTAVVAIAGGGTQCLALKSDGTVVAWGANWDGQCNVPAGLGDVVAVAGGGGGGSETTGRSLALKSDGTVVAWGRNEFGQCDVPAEVQGHVQAIVAGLWHNLALLAQYALPAKTPAGEGVSLTVGDFGYTFDQVSIAGETMVTASDTPPGSGLPADFKLLGSYYEISTTASYTAPVTIRIHYSPLGPPPVPPGKEANLQIFHWNATTSTWDPLETTVDTMNHVATAQTTSFSWFALGYPCHVFNGFLPPVAGATKPFKRGSTIPIKFRIAGKDGTPVTDAVAALVVYYLVDGAQAGEPEVVSTAAGDWGDRFRYDAAGDLYIYNLSTKDPSYLNYYTYQAVVTLEDGTTHSVDFSLK